MKDITVIIPVHKFNEKIKDLLNTAFESIKNNQETYTFGKLIPMVVAPGEILKHILLES